MWAAENGGATFMQSGSSTATLDKPRTGGPLQPGVGGGEHRARAGRAGAEAAWSAGWIAAWIAAWIAGGSLAAAWRVPRRRAGR